MKLAFLGYESRKSQLDFLCGSVVNGSMFALVGKER